MCLIKCVRDFWIFFFFLFAFMVLQHIRNKLSLMTAILLIIIFLASFSDSLDWNNGLLFLIAIV